MAYDTGAANRFAGTKAQMLALDAAHYPGVTYWAEDENGGTPYQSISGQWQRIGPGLSVSVGGGGPHTHPTSEVTGLDSALAGKAPSTHTHAQADVTGLSTALSGKSDSSHTHAELPTPGQKNALSGTQGTPADTNRYVTTQDARLSDARPPTAHQHPASDITGLPSGGAEFVRVKKSSDTPNSSNTTWVTDPHLTFSLTANTDYEFGFSIAFTSAALTTGLQLALTGPASPTLFAADIRVPISKTAEVQVKARAYDDPALGTAVDVINVPLLATITGLIRVGATAGSLAVRFRSEINASAVTLKQGSVGRLKSV